MRRPLPWLAALCLLAFALSWAYVHVYLRGGPRIIDATSYFLAAKSLAAGSFSFPASEPAAAFAGRFLQATPAGDRLGVIFPPGYPAVLSLGVRLGAALWVGPLLGALLVAATYGLARAFEQTTRVALLAAALSAVCAALRYHTADTMSHGLSALLGCAALLCARHRSERWGALGAGLCLGLFAATRPVSAGVSLLLVALSLRKARHGAWFALALGALPGLGLLLLQQHALTGSYFGSTQLAYYAASDAPPDCFRYGFGSGIGCRYEHGDFVARFLPDGYGAGPALRNTAVRLAAFASDATNALPLTLLALYGVYRHRRSALALLGLGVGVQTLAYVPFYFDGNYAGAGARLLAEAIPFCQVLVARAALDLKLDKLALPAALVGFALHGRAGHEQLRDREGGRPMFEPSVLEAAGVVRGLVFVDTDHGFNLGHDPAIADPTSAVMVARLRGDAHDRELMDRWPNAATTRYVFDPSGRAAPRLEPYGPPAEPRFESEAEWPAAPRRGSAYPIHHPCASAGRALRLKPSSVVRLPVPQQPGRLELGWVTTSEQPAQVLIKESGAPPQQLSAPPGCSRWPLTGPGTNPATDRAARVSVELVTGEGALDFLGRVP
jgi:hypothetical protein